MKISGSYNHETNVILLKKKKSFLYLLYIILIKKILNDTLQILNNISLFVGCYINII